MKNITRLFNVADRSLFYIDGSLDYDRITEAITKLADTVSETETDESTWCIGEYGNATLADLIIGAYWHYTEWHGGQWSAGYAALSSLGCVFSPGMTDGPEHETGEYSVYVMLNEMAEKHFNRVTV